MDKALKGDYIVHTDILPEEVIGPLVRQRAAAAGAGLAPGALVQYGLNKRHTFYDEAGDPYEAFVSWWVAPPAIGSRAK
jgi:hypothetical protein